MQKGLPAAFSRGKEDTFELIYRPRFYRVIRQKYHLEGQES